MAERESGDEPKSRKAKQERRNARNLRAYAAEKQALFELAFAKMMLAAKMLDEVDETGAAVIVPNTTNLDRYIDKALDRVQKEFVEKAEKKARELRYAKAQPQRKRGRPPKRRDY